MWIPPKVARGPLLRGVQMRTAAFPTLTHAGLWASEVLRADLSPCVHALKPARAWPSWALACSVESEIGHVPWAAAAPYAPLAATFLPRDSVMRARALPNSRRCPVQRFGGLQGGEGTPTPDKEAPGRGLVRHLKPNSSDH